MKALVVVLIVAQSFIAQADYKKVDISEHAISYVETDNYDFLYSYIPGLSNDLFKEYVLKDSRGPKWQADAIDSLYSLVGIHERTSYFGESYDGECDEYFSDPEYGPYDTDEIRPYFEWKAVKRVKGSKKSVMYVVEYYTQLTGDVMVDGSYECLIPEEEYVFLNKKDESGHGIYMGERSFRLPRNL